MTTTPPERIHWAIPFREEGVVCGSDSPDDTAVRSIKDVRCPWCCRILYELLRQVRDDYGAPTDKVCLLCGQDHPAEWRRPPLSLVTECPACKCGTGPNADEGDVDPTCECDCHAG